jgi:hypothetical protein
MYVSYCVVGEESFLVVPEFVHDPDTPISITFPQKTLQTNDKRPDCSQEQNKTKQQHSPIPLCSKSIIQSSFSGSRSRNLAHNSHALLTYVSR